MAIVVQGVYGGKKVVSHLNDLMAFWGCTPIQGAVLTGAIYPNTPQSEAVSEKNQKALECAAGRFEKALNQRRYLPPSFFRLAIFRATRTGLHYSPDALAADRQYFSDHGWMDAAYFTPVKLGPLKAAFGAMIDAMLRGVIRKDEKRKAQGS